MNPITPIINGLKITLGHLFKKPVTAGSDSHSCREVGNAGLILNGDPIEEILKRRVKIFGKHTSLLEITNRTSRKFARSVEWRLTGRKRQYSHNSQEKY